MAEQEKWFPIQRDHGSERDALGNIIRRWERPAGRVPWGLAAEAYKTYSAWYAISQSLEMLAASGGFGWAELAYLLRGKKDWPDGFMPFTNPKTTMSEPSPNDNNQDEVRVLRNARAAVLPNDTTWPTAGIQAGNLNWTLRYGEPTRGDILSAASIVSAYMHLISMPIKDRNSVVRWLRMAREIEWKLQQEQPGTVPVDENIDTGVAVETTEDDETGLWSDV